MMKGKARIQPGNVEIDLEDIEEISAGGIGQLRLCGVLIVYRDGRIRGAESLEIEPESVIDTMASYENCITLT